MYKKIYLVSYYFAPLGRADGVNRTYLAKYLAEAGWNIDVISCKNPNGFIRNFQKDESLLKILPETVKINQVAMPKTGVFDNILALGGITKDPFFRWCKPAIDKGENVINQQGIIYAIAPPITNVKIASALAKKHNMPLVIDFRDDDFSLDTEHTENAVGFVASTEKSLANMVATYNASGKKNITVYNGYAQNLSQEAKVKTESNRLSIIYGGLLNHLQDPLLLVRALRLMEKKYPNTNKQVTLNFYGPVNYYTKYFLSRYLNEHIRFHGYISFSDMIQKICNSDVAYSSLKPGKEYCIPSKVFQYLSTNTPVLATGPDGMLKDFINNNGFGKFSNYWDVNAQAEDIYSYLCNTQEYDNISKNIFKAKDSYFVKKQVQKLSEYLETVLA